MERERGWHLLGQMVWEQRIPMAGSLFFTVLATAAELLPYWIIFQAIEILLSTSQQITQQLYALLSWLMLALLAKYTLYAVAYFLSHQAAYNILTDTRHKLVAKLAHAPLEWLQQRTTGKLKHTVLQDVENIENFIAHHTVEVLSAAVNPVLVTLFLFWINWQLALAALLISPIAVLSSTLFMHGLTQEYLEYNESSAKLDSTMVEYLRNMPIMKLFRQDSTSFQVMRQRLQNYYGIIAKFTQKTVPGWSLFSSLVGASVLVILPTGIFLYEQGTITIPQVIMAVILGSGMLKPLLKISRFFMEINEVLASVRQIAPILALSTDKRGSESELATNYGGNSLAGIINIVTRQPTDETEGRVSLSYDDLTRRKLTGSFSTPINETLFFGSAVSIHKADGYIDNIFNSEDFGQRDDISARTKLRWLPNDKLDATLTLDYENFSGDSYAMGPYDAIINNPQQIDHDFSGKDIRDTLGVAATVNWRGNNIDVTSISSVRDWESVNSADQDGGSMQGLTSHTVSQEEHSQLSQELRFTPKNPSG